MDELRKLEHRGNDLLKGHKYTLLKNKRTPKLKEVIDRLMNNPQSKIEGLSGSLPRATQPEICV